MQVGFGVNRLTRFLSTFASNHLHGLTPLHIPNHSLVSSFARETNPTAPRSIRTASIVPLPTAWLARLSTNHGPTDIRFPQRLQLIDAWHPASCSQLAVGAHPLSLFSNLYKMLEVEDIILPLSFVRHQFCTVDHAKPDRIQPRVDRNGMPFFIQSRSTQCTISQRTCSRLTVMSLTKKWFPANGCTMGFPAMSQ